MDVCMCEVLIIHWSLSCDYCLDMRKWSLDDVPFSLCSPSIVHKKYLRQLRYCPPPLRDGIQIYPTDTPRSYIFGTHWYSSYAGVLYILGKWLESMVRLNRCLRSCPDEYGLFCNRIFFTLTRVEGALNHSGKCSFGERIKWFCIDRRPIRVKRKLHGFKNVRIRVDGDLQSWSATYLALHHLFSANLFFTYSIRTILGHDILTVKRVKCSTQIKTRTYIQLT